jgi:glutathione peroxidase
MKTWKQLLVAVVAASVMAAGVARAADKPKIQFGQGSKERAADKAAAAAKNKSKDKAKGEEVSLLSHKMKSLDGKPVDLSQYEGKVVLIVNVASKCGYTKQYAGLEQLHEKYKDKGLVVLGFPCNQFGGQEPGSPEEIAEFCKQNFGVKFDLFEKVTVNDDPKKGEKAIPLYKQLTSKEVTPKDPGKVEWNFEKFLIGRDGKVAARFRSKVEPNSDEFVKAVEAELAKK